MRVAVFETIICAFSFLRMDKDCIRVSGSLQKAGFVNPLLEVEKKKKKRFDSRICI